MDILKSLRAFCTLILSASRTQVISVICSFAACLVAVPLQSASATKTAPPLPIQLTAPAMVKVGSTFEYLLHIPNKTSSNYWSVTSQINFPSSVNCTTIVSQSRSGCTLKTDAQGRGTGLTCSYADVYDWQIIDVRVSCTLDATAPCNSQISTTANLTVMKPSAQTNSSTAVLSVMCLAPTATATSTPLPVYTATPTFTPTFTPAFTPTGIPTSTPSRVPTASPTPTTAVVIGCPVTPIVNCVNNNGDGSYTAYFGYENTSNQTLTLSAGLNDATRGQNIFSPLPVSRGQVESFKPGSFSGVFSLKFDGSPLTWTLRTPGSSAHTATAKAGVSKSCSPVTPVLSCIDKLPGSKIKAYFGYTNLNNFEVAIPVSGYNSLTPGAADKGQPTKFFTGSVANAFNVEFTTPSLTWNIFSSSAKADAASNECNPNKSPVCSAGSSPYAVNCQGTTTIVALNGTLSKDPEGFPITYLWTTDCSTSVFDDSKKSSPTLAVTALANGAARSCSVSLKVDDGVSTSSCSQSLTVTSCSVDCSGKPGGTSIKDACGVCGGNGNSCVDCAGVQNGTAVVDKCGVCAGTNKCLDCAGVPNGSGKLDQCGVCNGDGKSCLSCVKSNVSETLFALDSNAKALRVNVTLATRRLLLLDNSKKNQQYATRTQAEAATLGNNAWIKIWTVPQVINSCTNAEACSQVDNSTSIAAYTADFENLRQLTDRTLRLVRKARGGKLSPTEQKISKETDDLVAQSAQLSASIPRFSSTCN